MPRVQDVIEMLQEYKPDDVIAYSIWSVPDVESEIDGTDIELTQQEKEDVLERVYENFDSECGITWGSIRDSIYEVLGERKAI